MKKLLTVLSLVALLGSPALAVLDLDLTFDSATEWTDNSFGFATYNDLNMNSQINAGAGTYDASYAANEQARAYGSPHPTNNPGGTDLLASITPNASIYGWVEITHSTFGVWRDINAFGVTAQDMDANFSMFIEENNWNILKCRMNCNN